MAFFLCELEIPGLPIPGSDLSVQFILQGFFPGDPLRVFLIPGIDIKVVGISIFPIKLTQIAVTACPNEYTGLRMK